jgi:hypothetical protein
MILLEIVSVVEKLAMWLATQTGLEEITARDSTVLGGARRAG